MLQLGLLGQVLLIRHILYVCGDSHSVSMCQSAVGKIMINTLNK